MKHAMITLTLLCGMLLGATTGAHAACSVEYKAKQDDPLKLFHDVAVVPGPCDEGTVRTQLQSKLSEQGLVLLKVMSVKDQ